MSELSSAPKPGAKTLILGLGNPILGDDGVGLVIVQGLRGRVKGSDVAGTTGSGLALLDLVAGYDQLYVVDALLSRDGRVGDLVKIEDGDGAGLIHFFSSHGLDFFNIMQLGRELGYQIPKLAGVYGIKIGEKVSFDENLSEPIKERIETIRQAIIRDIVAGQPQDTT
ncbi:MAG: hydrogenase maturation protease [Deltaproteobacteria bacterium]|nr:hydrogenase maturation protease [Deltaproteobacteria bacterium]